MFGDVDAELVELDAELSVDTLGTIERTVELPQAAIGEPGGHAWAAVFRLLVAVRHGQRSVTTAASPFCASSTSSVSYGSHVSG